MGRQHLAVGIYVHARSGRLFEQLFEVFQVVSAYQNPRILPHADIDFGDLGIPVGGRIGFVEQRHRLDAALSHVQHQRDELIDSDIRTAHLGERVFEYGENVLIGKPEVQRVLRIGRSTLYAVNDHLFERTDVFALHTQHADFFRN